MDFLDAINDLINNLIGMLGSAGAILGCLFILVESILPILPLSVFITLNFMTFGKFFGFIISWICTIGGCMLSFYIFKNGLSMILYNKFKSNKKLVKVMHSIENMSFRKLVVLIAIPFTPAFLVNISAGISRMDTKKFFWAIVIGKISLVYFWGYIGVSLIDSIRNPMILIKVVIMLIIMYLISFVFSKRTNVR